MQKNLVYELLIWTRSNVNIARKLLSDKLIVRSDVLSISKLSCRRPNPNFPSIDKLVHVCMQFIELKYYGGRA